MTDEQAMWRVRSTGDAEAFAELVRRWERPIQDLCFRMVGDPHTSQDLTQETFARVFAHRQDFAGEARFSTWLWRIALNLCRDHLRRRQRWQEEPWVEVMEEALGDTEARPDSALERQEEADWVRGCLMALPEMYRAVLVLRHYENLKFAEIAAVLEIPEGTVKSRMAMGLSLLAEKLKACPVNRPGHSPPVETPFPKLN